MLDPTTATLDEIRAFVGERMEGSPEPVALYWIECRCLVQGRLPDRGPHGYLGEGDYCAAHIKAAVKEQKFGPNDWGCEASAGVVEEGDRVRRCAWCDVALVCVLMPDGIDEELKHWLSEDYGPPVSAIQWREFSLCLPSPESEEELDPRVRQVLARVLAAEGLRDAASVIIAQVRRSGTDYLPAAEVATMRAWLSGLSDRDRIQELLCAAKLIEPEVDQLWVILGREPLAGEYRALGEFLLEAAQTCEAAALKRGERLADACPFCEKGTSTVPARTGFVRKPCPTCGGTGKRPGASSSG